MKTIRIEILNEFEAEIFINILEEEKIPYALIQNKSLAYNGIFEIPMGWGYVEIPEEYEILAKKLYNDFKNSK
jgi:hypothetical protein